jgi:phospho-N-acetylmuramoyl-pentapeptide-transferase
MMAIVCGDPTSAVWWVLALGSFSMALMGLQDDWLKVTTQCYRGMSPRQKLLIQGCTGALLSAAALYATSSSPDLFSGSLFIPWWGWVSLVGPSSVLLLMSFGAFTFTGGTNAVNLTDGMDGLLAGLLTISFGFFGLYCLTMSPTEISPLTQEILIWLSAALGAVLGFLPFNRYPAKIFMGDVGSMGLGGLLCTAVLLLRAELLLAIVGGVFVMETLSVVLQVWSLRVRGTRMFRCAPIHHHFEMGGIPESSLVYRFWAVGAALALLGWSSLR